MSYTVEGPPVTMGRMIEYDGLKLKRRYRKKFNSYRNFMVRTWLDRYESLDYFNCLNDGKRLTFEIVTSVKHWKKQRLGRPPIDFYWRKKGGKIRIIRKVE